MPKTIKDLEEAKDVMSKKMERLKLSTKIDLQRRVKDHTTKLEILTKEYHQLCQEIQEVKDRIWSIQNYLKERG